MWSTLFFFPVKCRVSSRVSRDNPTTKWNPRRLSSVSLSWWNLSQVQVSGPKLRPDTGSNIRPSAVQVNMAHRSSEFKLFHSFWPNRCDRLWGWRPRRARSNYVVLPHVMFSLLRLLCLFSVFTCVLTLKRYSGPGPTFKKSYSNIDFINFLTSASARVGCCERRTPGQKMLNNLQTLDIYIFFPQLCVSTRDPPMFWMSKPCGGFRVRLVHPFLRTCRWTSLPWMSSTRSSIQPRKKMWARACVSALFQKCCMFTALKLANTS